MARFFGLSRNRSDADTQRFIERKRRELERRERKLRERSKGRARKTTSVNVVKGFSKRETQTYDRVLGALGETTKHTRKYPNGMPLREAVKLHHTTLRSVHLYAGSAIDREHGQIVVKKTDSLIRPMRVVTTNGVQIVYVRGRRQAALVAKHFATSVAFTEGNAGRAAFRKFQNKTVAGHWLETDPDLAAQAIDDAGVDYDDLYQDRAA